MDNFLESPGFQDDLHAACRRAMSSHGFAQSKYRTVKDLEQAVLVRFFKWLPRYKGSLKCRPVLRKIAKNLLIDEGRRSARHGLEIDWDTVDLDSLRGPSGKEIETKILFHECMDLLSQEQRHAYIECRWNGRTSRDVAKDLKVSAPTVINRLNEATQILEECMLDK